ncbi:ATP-binding protein [Allostreptomyces psammosilenae]|uniref:Anti-sigma regulatory factor (Ser/Thr protein kinase) n=1 Tax=Allostreptomyces psammosilenae TaxID=1892865 RepID=A0A853A3B6_9ACTN|nr:ATP-binding protein [Allostreptomyces psammosilenae]NYI07364.1 anti-sigma regulatory factor (Ser/Thr protein kinase) [Allostreptomyces psammosilenae]
MDGMDGCEGDLPASTGAAAPVDRRYQMDAHGRCSFRLPPVEPSVPRARHVVRDTLAAWGVPAGEELSDAVQLIVSELVTNSVRYAARCSENVRVELRLAPDHVRIAVADRDPVAPRALWQVPGLSQASTAREGGRGLLLVRAVAEGHGGSCDMDGTVEGGKEIWALLPRVPTRPGRTTTGSLHAVQ